MQRNDTMTKAITGIAQALGTRLLSSEQRSQERAFVEVAPESVPEISGVLFNELGARLQTASGVDTPAGIEVLYHWALDGKGDGAGCVISVRTLLEGDSPELQSITSACPAAEWIERELWELLGVQIRNHPDLRHLLLRDDWPEGRYPLRRDFDAEGAS